MQLITKNRESKAEVIRPTPTSRNLEYHATGNGKKCTKFQNTPLSPSSGMKNSSSKQRKLPHR
jgi:hypothetical protein